MVPLPYTILTNQDYIERRERGEPITLLDVRDMDEYCQGHVPGSVCIPWYALRHQISLLPKDQEIAVICRTINRSAAVCRFLDRHGYQTSLVTPGISQWSEPLEGGGEGLDFPRPRPIYLDHAATTPVHPEVIVAMTEALRNAWGNPSSPYCLGRRAKAQVEAARRELGDLIGARQGQIIFTSGGTESDDLGIRGLLRGTGHPNPHFITTSIEHKAVLKVAKALEREGIRVSILPVGPSGRVDPQLLQETLTPDTVLVSMAWANNETGILQPVREVREITARQGVLFHTDAVQAVGQISVDVDEIGVDALSLSGHKFYGPKGIGALYVRNPDLLSPVLPGGGQEGGMRGGTENIPGIVGMGRAARLAKELLEIAGERIRELREQLWEELQRWPGVVRHGEGERLPGILLLSFPGVLGKDLVLDLDILGFCVAHGSACGSKNQSSHVLQAMGVSEDLAMSAVRISLGRGTTWEQIREFLEAIESVLKR